jgi:hypothetical protein
MINRFFKRWWRWLVAGACLGVIISVLHMANEGWYPPMFTGNLWADQVIAVLVNALQPALILFVIGAVLQSVRRCLDDNFKTDTEGVNDPTPPEDGPKSPLLRVWNYLGLLKKNKPWSASGYGLR